MVGPIHYGHATTYNHKRLAACFAEGEINQSAEL
jgi:hypothetical protein